MAKVIVARCAKMLGFSSFFVLPAWMALGGMWCFLWAVDFFRVHPVSPIFRLLSYLAGSFITLFLVGRRLHWKWIDFEWEKWRQDVRNAQGGG